MLRIDMRGLNRAFDSVIGSLEAVIGPEYLLCLDQNIVVGIIAIATPKANIIIVVVVQVYPKHPPPKKKKHA